jgi:hypothetical protein
MSDKFKNTGEALNYYKLFSIETNSTDRKLLDYAKQRISKLKKQHIS